MSQKLGSVDSTEEVKSDVLAVFTEQTTENVVGGIEEKVDEPKVEPKVEPKEDSTEIRKAYQLRLDDARRRIIAAMQDSVYPLVATDPALPKTMSIGEYEVTRYLSGLNLKAGAKPKEVRAYEATKKKALDNLVKYEKLADDTEALFGKALDNKQKEIEQRESLRDEEIERIKVSDKLAEKQESASKMVIKNPNGSVIQFRGNLVGTRNFFNGILNDSKRNKEHPAARTGLESLGKFEQLQDEIKSTQDKISKVESQCSLDVKKLETSRDALKRQQVIEWSNPGDIFYGTRLGPTQLNAKLTKGDGKLKYESAQGWDIDGVLLSAGDHQLKVTALGTDLFKASEPKTVTIKVKPAKLEINCTDVATPLIFGAPLTAQHLSATVTTDPPQPDAYKGLVKTLVFTEKGKKLDINAVLDAGEHTIDVNLAPNKNFEPPAAKTKKIKVDRATQELDWPAPSPLTFVYGMPLVIGQLNATLTSNSPASSLQGLASPIKYTDAKSNPVRVGSYLDAGTQTITANAAENANFLVAVAKSATFEVEPDAREIITSALKPIEAVVTKVDMEQLKRRIKLSKGKDELEFSIGGTKLAVGVALKCRNGQVVKATALPANNYKATEAKEVSVDVIRQKPVISWKEPEPLQAHAVNGVRLPAGLFNATVTLGDKPLSYSHAVNDTVYGNTGDEPKIMFLTATHPESDKFERGTKTVRLLVVNNAQAGKGYEDMIDGTGFDVDGLTVSQKKLYDNFVADKDGVKTATIELIQQIQDLTGPEMEEFLNELVPEDQRDDERITKSWKAYPNVLYALPNGMQARYKPFGDDFNPDPMFCIEARTSTGTSENLDDVAFKITLEGVATAKGPSQNKSLTGRPYYDSQYKKGTCMTTHFQCAPKVDHFVEWQVPKDLAYSAQSSEAWAKLPRDAGAATWQWPANMTGNRFAVGDGQEVKLTLAETKKYKQTIAQTTFDVKPARQVISFEKALEIDYGTEFDTALLKASLKVEPAGAGEVVSGTLASLQSALQFLDGKSEAAAGKLFDAPQVELKIVAPATENFSEAIEPVSVRIKPCAMTIQWNIDEVVEIEEGTELSAAHLSATVVTLPAREAEYNRLRDGLSYVDIEGKEVRPGAQLPVGEHRITARSAGEVNFSAPAEVSKTIRVKEKTEL